MLTKSDFRSGLACVKKLWLDKHRRYLRPAPSEADLDRMRMGMEVGRLARALMPDGVLIDSAGFEAQEAAEMTLREMDHGSDRLFEATFLTGDRMARVDILQRSGSGWVLDEVKSSTVKDPKLLEKAGLIHDIAFQVSVLRQSGIEVEAARLVLIDSSYVWDGGPLDVGRLLKPVDVTAECFDLQEELDRRVGEFSRVVEDDSPPEIETNTYCSGCSYYDHCHEAQPKHDVVHLPLIRADGVRKLRELGYRSIDLIPEDHKLSDGMRRVREVVVTGRPYIGPGLADALDQIRFPAAFIDFESTTTPIPIFPLTRPYQQICFQWSVHVLDARDAEPRHLEFLHEDASDPREEFCRSLFDAIRHCRSVVHYSSFEKTQLKAMAADGIAKAQELVDLITERGVDLEQIVKEQVYLEAFKGRSSIKYVLPALVPSMSYEGMAIGDGNAAASAFRRMVGLPPGADRDRIRGELLEYCCQDTLGMVRVYVAVSALLVDQPGLF